MKKIGVVILSLLALNVNAQNIDYDRYCEKIFELIQNKQVQNIDQYIRPAEQQLKIMHWEANDANIDLVEQMNAAIKDSIKKSIFAIHDEFSTNGLNLLEANYKRFERDVSHNYQSEIKLFITIADKEYWIKIFADSYFIKDRFKSQFDQSLTFTEEFNKRSYRTESKPLAKDSLNTTTLQIIETCYDENAIRQYGAAKDLQVLFRDSIDENEISIITFSKKNKSKPQVVVLSIDPINKTCYIEKE